MTRYLAEPVDKLSGVMLQVAQVHELVLKLGHPVPRKAAVSRAEIKMVHRGFDRGLAVQAVGLDLVH